MRCRVSDVGEKRTIGVLFGVIADKGRCFIADSICEEVTFREFVVLDTCVITRQRVRFPEICSTGDNTVILVKSTLAGPTMLGSITTGMPRDMPLSAHIGAVTL